jgi:hypothetical protein
MISIEIILVFCVPLTINFVICNCVPNQLNIFARFKTTYSSSKIKIITQETFLKK